MYSFIPVIMNFYEISGLTIDGELGGFNQTVKRTVKFILSMCLLQKP